MTRTVLLGDICSLITKGTTPTTYGKSFVKSGINFIKVESITCNGTFLTDKFMHIDYETHENLLKRSIIQQGDILLTMAGAIGRVAYVKDDSILPANTNQAVSIIRITSPDVNPLYVRYFLESESAKIQFFGGTVQTAQPNLSLGNISKIRVDLPNLEQQNKVVHILEKVDEKIEINRQMNETLEQMGQALFRHYFIDNSEAKGWGKVSLGQKIHPKRGKSLTSKNMKDGTIPVVSGGLQPAGLHSEANTKTPVITVSASGANAGFVALWGDNIWSADSSFVDKTITDNVYFYYIFLKINQDKIYGMQTGAAQPHIYPSHLELLEIPNAPSNVVSRFNDEVSALFGKIENNKREIQTLTSLRDTLLPRLISGKILL